MFEAAGASHPKSTKAHMVAPKLVKVVKRAERERLGQQAAGSMSPKPSSRDRARALAARVKEWVSEFEQARPVRLQELKQQLGWQEVGGGRLTAQAGSESVGRGEAAAARIRRHRGVRRSDDRCTTEQATSGRGVVGSRRAADNLIPRARLLTREQSFIERSRRRDRPEHVHQPPRTDTEEVSRQIRKVEGDVRLGRHRPSTVAQVCLYPDRK